MLVCDNETNAVALFGAAGNPTPRTPRTASTAASSHGDAAAVNPDGTGTKAAFWYRFDAVAPGETVRGPAAPVDRDDPDERHLRPRASTRCSPTARREADEFYAAVIPHGRSDEDRHDRPARLRRPAVGQAALPLRRRPTGSTATRRSRRRRRSGRDRGRRNAGWRHLALADVISMPDEWEYPWFAAWDLAFHCVALAHVDPGVRQGAAACCMCREWAMHPNGQLPAYEWAFGDVNPPVHAWAAWQVYRDRRPRATSDFLIRVFTKLLLNFSWWVNRKDADGSNLFEGGFLGMDNIGLFDRSAPLPPGLPAGGVRRDQLDGVLLPARCCRSRSSWPGTTRPGTTSRPSSSSTSWRSPTR